MSRKELDRRALLRTSGTALAALTGISLGGNAAADADTDCIGCGGGGDDGGDGGSTGSTPTVTTKYVTVDGDRATMDGALDSLGDDDSADVWIEWGPEGDGLPYDTRLDTYYQPTWYSGETFDGLASGTYEYRAAGSNDWGHTHDTIRTFTV